MKVGCLLIEFVGDVESSTKTQRTHGKKEENDQRGVEKAESFKFSPLVESSQIAGKHQVKV